MEQYQQTGFALKRNHCNAIPRYIVAFDTETVPIQSDINGRTFTHKWRLATAVYARIVGMRPSGLRVERFTDPDQWWAFLKGLTGSRHTVWCVAHNALFDLVVARMPEQFFNSTLVIDKPRGKRNRVEPDPEHPHCHGIKVLECPPFILGAKFPETQGRVVFVDSLNWFPQSLASLGESAGIPKFPMPAFEECDETWFRYCERDSQIVFTTFVELIKWVADNDMGMFRYTAPAQAMSAYRHRFMTHKIFIHDNAEIKQLERRAYFGGRTEVFRMGKVGTIIHQLDVNALYPSVMADGYFPCRLKRSEIRLEYLPMLPDLDWDSSIAEVALSTPEPLFPIRTPNVIIYPTGEFRTTLAGAELGYAKHHGYIRGVRSWAEYDVAPLFADWVAELWAMRSLYRRESNTLYAEFSKKLMNSLYGKFGQLAHEWVESADEIAAEPWSSWTVLDMTTGKRTRYRSVGWDVQRQIDRRVFTVRKAIEQGIETTELTEESAELEGTFPAISAFVTAAGRMRMNNLRSMAGHRNVFYQGVDGLMVTSEGLRNLDAKGQLGTTELGLLRLELSTDDGEIFGCSDYTLADKVVLAGRARTWFDHESGELLQRKFSIANHLFRGVNLDAVQEQDLPWKRTSRYCKGVVQPDGWVVPFELAAAPLPATQGCNPADAAVSAIADTTGEISASGQALHSCTDKSSTCSDSSVDNP